MRSVRRLRHPRAVSIRPATCVRVVALSHDVNTVVQVTPRTGNRHQIRVHLSCAGFPIAGDELYGGPPLAELCARPLLASPDGTGI